MTEAERIEKALNFAMSYATTDGAHHKLWVIDQMVRSLTDCPVVVVHRTDVNGVPYSFEDQGESDQYRAWVAEHNDGEDGLDTYEWDEGIAP